MISKLFSQDNQKDHPVLGIICALLAMLLFSVMGLFAKILSTDMSVFAIVFYRNTIGLVMVGGALLLTGKFYYLKTSRPGAHIVRALVGTTGIILTYNTLAILSMSQATVLFFASSLMLPLLSIVLLKEFVGLPRWIAILIGFGGVVIASQPIGMVPIIGLVFALSTAFIHALVGIILRWVGKTEGVVTTTFYFVLIGTLSLVPLMLFIDSTIPAGKIWMILMVGVCGGVAQMFLTGAFKFAAPAIISPFTYTSLIWAAVFDLLIFSSAPTIYVISGGAIIIGCSMFILYRESQNSRKEKIEAEVKAEVML